MLIFCITSTDVLNYSTWQEGRGHNYATHVSYEGVRQPKRSHKIETPQEDTQKFQLAVQKTLLPKNTFLAYHHLF